MNAEEHAENLKAEGMKQYTLAGYLAALRDLGYHLRTGGYCDCNARFMTGPHAGKSYPCRTLYPIHTASKQSAFHFEQAGTPQLAALQEFRGEAFALSRGRIIEV